MVSVSLPCPENVIDSGVKFNSRYMFDVDQRGAAGGYNQLGEHKLGRQAKRRGYQQVLYCMC